MIRTIIESPFAGDTKKNTEYARAALLDSLRRGEAPIASHLLHTQVLDDSKADDRLLGMQAGYAWISVAQQMAVYIDRGISDGMKLAVNLALQDGPGKPVLLVRSLKYRLNFQIEIGAWQHLCNTMADNGTAPADVLRAIAGDEGAWIQHFNLTLFDAETDTERARR